MARNKLSAVVKRLEIIIVLLVIIVAGLAIYISYPSIKLAINGQPYGTRLTGINTALTTPQLSVINNAPNNNFEIAAQKLLNGSIPGERISNGTYTGPLFELSLQKPPQHSALIINGKPSVIYIGATSCIYCGESRWAMTLALSRFGTFNSLYVGYSSIGDSDVPTLYWVQQNITTKGSARFGNSYSSNYINFYSAEYDSPITKGFEFPATSDPIQFFVANATNSSYLQAMQLMNNTKAFQGTPFTLWGTSLNLGAASVIFSNGTNTTSLTNTPPLTYMSHQQIYDQLSTFNSTFSYEEYAGADVYIAQMCPSINNSAPICQLSGIQQMESKMGLA